MNYVIREMEKKDIKQVQNVAKTSWNATYEGIIPNSVQVKFLESAYSDTMMERRLDVSFLYVAEVENRVVGFAIFSPVKDEGEVELGAIYLLPEYQGNGIGTALLQEGTNKIDGIKNIFINVEKENKIGRNFYEAKGFEVVDEFEENFDGHLLQNVRMVLKI